MGFIDLILFPLYVLLFSIIFYWRRKRIKDPILKRYQKQGFWIKVFGTIAFTVFHRIVSPGNDSYGLFYTEGINIANLISADSSNIKLLFSPGIDFDQTYLADPYNAGYFKSEGNYIITRFVTVLSFVSFQNYMVINLFFSMISFSGVWQLYKFFYEQYPHLHKKLAIAILYFPTFVFWSSGILKDPIATGMLGWITYAIYRTFYKRESIIKNLVIAFIAGYIITTVKSYILVSYLPFLMLFLVLATVKRIKKHTLKIAAFLTLLIVAPLGIYIIGDKLQEELGTLALDKLAESVKVQQTAFINIGDNAESAFSLGVDFDGSNSSLVKMAPAAITATFYRPFLWESKKISTLLSSLESLALMIFTVFVFIRTGPVHFIKIILKDPMVTFCFFFSLVFALFVGSTTLNFGTLVRYKIPCMPFYIIALILINETYKHNKSIRLKTKDADKEGLLKATI